jgi:hypothetical protein
MVLRIRAAAAGYDRHEPGVYKSRHGAAANKIWKLEDVQLSSLVESKQTGNALEVASIAAPSPYWSISIWTAFQIST